MRAFLLLFSIVLIATVPVGSAERAMTGGELRALVAVNKVWKLGGPSSGYYGALVLKGARSGTGVGTVYQGKKLLKFKGTWRLDGNKFCRKWDKFDGGAEVCETFAYITDTSVRVLVDGQDQGINSW